MTRPSGLSTRPEELAREACGKWARPKQGTINLACEHDIAAAIRKAVDEALMEAVTAGELGQHCEPTYVNVDRIFAIRDRWLGEENS